MNRYDMKKKVSAYIHKHQLMADDALHLVALSGGADSVALLLVLHDLGYRVEATHCNFHLRGTESERDENFVIQLCQTHDIPLHLIHFDTKEYAVLHKVSIEMAARELRYSYFSQLRRDVGADSVCVAHHRDDAVETFLMNLLRGSGIHGLTGIRPKNGFVVRPFLCVSREEIEQYLDSIGQDYVTDSTNLQDHVLRNKIRLHLIPLLKTLNPQAVENIDKTADFLKELEKLFNITTASSLQSLIEKDTNNDAQSIAIPSLRSQPSTEILIYEWLSPFGFNSFQIADICNHLESHSGKTFSSSSHIVAIDRDELRLEPITIPMKPLRIPETGCYCYSEKYSFNISSEDNITISKSAYSVTLDKERVSFPLTIRQTQDGDRFHPFGMNGHKLVSDYLTDIKLSILEKRRQLVVTDASGEIIWLVGRRICHQCRVTEQTSLILRITLVKTP